MADFGCLDGCLEPARSSRHPPQSLTHVSCGLPKRQANLELGAGPDAAEGEAPGGQITRPPLACGHPNTAGESDGKRVAFF